MNSIRKRLQVQPPPRGLWTAMVRFEVHAAPADPDAHELWIHMPGRRIVRWKISPAAWLCGDEPLLAVEEPSLSERPDWDTYPIDIGFGIVDVGVDDLQSLRRMEQGLLAGRFSIQLEGVQVQGRLCFTRYGKRDSRRWVVRRGPEKRQSWKRQGHV